MTATHITDMSYLRHQTVLNTILSAIKVPIPDFLIAGNKDDTA